MITKLVLKNFKSVATETYEFTDFDLLVGRNNSGKSTILQAMAIWQFGQVQDPYDVRVAALQPNHRIQILDRRIPLDKFLRRGSVEWLLNRIAELRDEEVSIESRRKDPNLPASEGNRLAAELAQKRGERQRITAEWEQLKAQADKVDAQLAAAQAGGGGARNPEVESLRRQAFALHSPALPIEMTFTVYRTTKGVVGEPVYASLKAINPYTGEDWLEPFPIREYYTNKLSIPASILAGSHGALRIEVNQLGLVEQISGLVEPLLPLAHIRR